MKKIVIIFIYFILYADNLRIYYDYDRAVSFALNENKKIILINKVTNNRWYKKLKKITLNDTKIKQVINKNYILVIVNRDNDNYPVRFYSKKPLTIFIINPNSTIEDDMIVGYITPNRFLSLIK